MKTLEQFINENIYDEDGRLEITIPHRSFSQVLDFELSKITGKTRNSTQDIEAHFSKDEFDAFRENLSQNISKEINAYIKGSLDILYSQWVKEIKKAGGTVKEVQDLRGYFDFDIAIHNIRNS